MTPERRTTKSACGGPAELAGLACGHCGSSHVVVVPHPTHHRKAECGDCGRYIKFLGREPLPMPSITRDPSLPPATLRGTPGQVAAGQSIRVALVAKFRAEGRRDVVDVLLSIGDATWFLANKGRSLDQIRWPGPDQLDNAA